VERRALIRSRTNRLGVLVAGYSLLALSPAEARQLPPKEASEAPSAQDRVEEIIVTARRRPEPLQRTPVSIVALTSEDLESRSITNLRSLQNFVPNLTFAPSQNVGEAAANVFIRGIGQEDFSVGAEAGVGFYVDGVYFARSLGMIANLVDVDRIEVLRGPQGTLFGKNTIGGAINLISVAPRANRERRVSLILGNDRRRELRTVLNESLTDRLLMRLSVGIVSRDGYLRRLSPLAPRDEIERANGRPLNLQSEGDDRSQGALLQLRWSVTETLTADLSLDGSRKRNRQGANHIDAIDPRFGIFPQINELIRQGKLPGPEITNELVPDNLLVSYAAGNNLTDQDLWGASVVLTKTLGAKTLKFIGAYRALRSRAATDIDGLYFEIAANDLAVKQHQLSGELQLNGKAGRLTYTTGLFGFGERPTILPTISLTDVLYTCGCFYPPDQRPILSTLNRRLRDANFAGYAQGTYELTDRLSTTLGARYSHERKSVDGEAFLADSDLQPTNTLFAAGHSKDSWNSFTYRAGAEYQATSDLMIYGSLARGFKTGGFNVRGDPALPNLGFYSFDPETAVTYEIGLRSHWLDRKLLLNATVFDTEYKDIQLRQQTIIAGEITTLIENAAKARIRGAEVELRAVPLTGLTLSAAYGNLAPRYLDVGRVRGLTLDTRFQRTPRHSFTGSFNYQMPAWSGIIALHGDYSYRSREQFQILAAVNDQPGYGLLAARVTFRTGDDRWAFALFGTNLTDKHYRSAGRGTLIDQVGFAFSSIGLPRQLGFQVTTGF
jgi:iron complex outermembrane recepter protein